MRHISIEKKYTLFFSLLVTIVIFVCWCANALLLSKYYTSKKLSSIQNMYEQLDAAANEYGTDSEEFKTIFENNSATFNCDVLVLDQEMKVVISNVMDDAVATERLLGYFFDKNQMSEQPPMVVEKTDKYTMQLSTDLSEGQEYIELWGVFSSGNLIVIRSAVAGIHNNAKMANILLAYISIVGVLISVLVCGFVGKIISRNAALELELKKRNEMDDMRKDFLSNVSHELKTPIALIQGYAEGLADCVNDDEESRNFYCEVITEETAKMNTLVRNLLELNELEFGDNKLSIETFDITELIKNCIMHFDMIIEQKEVKVQLEQEEPVLVLSDEFKIEQVFNNYLSNAINYASNDKIVRVTVEKKDDKVRIVVFNSGENIPSDSIDQIWDKFYKVDKARTREYGGSGVGLSIVKASMEALNQQYGVVNCKDGVEFWFEVDSI